MINTDYRIDALALLLDENCLMERYCPLIAYKDVLIEGLCRLGCKTKSDAAKLTDGELASAGLTDADAVRLFRRFLVLYDPKPGKFKEIAKLTADESERAALAELYHLPGVKYTRAHLYYLAGYACLADIAAATVDEVQTRTNQAIDRCGMTASVPLPKEIRTHIAVSKAFTEA